MSDPTVPGQEPVGAPVPPAPPSGPQTPAGGSTVPPGGYQQPVYAPPPPLNDADQRLWATLIHVGSIFLGFISPLVGFLTLKDRGTFVREHARQSLNFQITIVIAWVVVGFIALVPVIGAISLILTPVLWVIMIVFPILAAVAANRGQWYKYPIAIDFIH